MWHTVAAVAVAVAVLALCDLFGLAASSFTAPQLSRALRDHARSIAGKSQLFINAFAKALEVSRGTNTRKSRAGRQSPFTCLGVALVEAMILDQDKPAVL